MREKAVQYFAEVNKDDLSREMAKGEGEKLMTLASLYGCESATTRTEFARAAQANFGKILAYAEKSGFRTRPAVNADFEAQMMRSHAYLQSRKASEANHLALGEAVAVKGVNCFQCHFRVGQPPPADPIAWAPDLNGVRSRLREEWVRDWLRDPALVYPGTSMPANFSSSPAQYQEHYPNSSNEDQIRVVLEWLYNFDRMYMGSRN